MHCLGLGTVMFSWIICKHSSLLLGHSMNCYQIQQTPFPSMPTPWALGRIKIWHRLYWEPWQTIFSSDSWAVSAGQSYEWPFCWDFQGRTIQLLINEIAQVCLQVVYANKQSQYYDSCFSSYRAALQKETCSNEDNSDYMKWVLILLKWLLFKKITQVRGWQKFLSSPETKNLFTCLIGFSYISLLFLHYITVTGLLNWQHPNRCLRNGSLLKAGIAYLTYQTSVITTH